MTAAPIADMSPMSTNVGSTPTCSYARHGRNIGPLLSPKYESYHRFAVIWERHRAWIPPAWFSSLELVVVKPVRRP